MEDGLVKRIRSRLPLYQIVLNLMYKVIQEETTAWVFGAVALRGDIDRYLMAGWVQGLLRQKYW